MSVIRFSKSARTARPPVRRLSVLVALIGIFLLSSCSADETMSAGGEGGAGELFDLEFTTADGGTGTLAAYEGQPMVINFFAAWCPPCRREMPDFEAAAQANAGTVTFVGVSHDLDETSWKSLVEETGVTFDTVFQPDQEIFDAVDASVMPTTIFVTADGDVVKRFAGTLTEERIQELIDELLI